MLPITGNVVHVDEHVHVVFWSQRDVLELVQVEKCPGVETLLEATMTCMAGHSYPVYPVLISYFNYIISFDPQFYSTGLFPLKGNRLEEHDHFFF